MIETILHFAEHLNTFVASYGAWAYCILFAIIFCETGLVITRFLPGDTLLFTAGALSAIGALNISYLIPLLILAALLGDNVNYTIGRSLGHKLFKNDNSKIL